MATVGVLALQGAFSKHMESLRLLHTRSVPVRSPKDLQLCDGLIIPGGESSTIAKLMSFVSLWDPIKHFAKDHPVFGTCAGIILMGQEVIGHSPFSPLGLLDITCERNAFGRQTESFTTQLPINLPFIPPSEQCRKKNVPAVFIRAPQITKLSPLTQVLSRLHGQATFVQQGMHLGATFHPELSGDLSIHQYFLNLIPKH